jgi:outer membrane cobalamin receptor
LLSPRLGVVLASDLGASRASVGRGFRAPTLAERYVSTEVNGIPVVANPGLQPETAWSIEVGHQQVFARGRAHVDVAAFWTATDKLIEPVVLDTGQIQFQNVKSARIAGLDLHLTATPLPGLTMSLAHTFLDTRSDATMDRAAGPLAFRPRHVVTLSADYRVGAATVGGDVRYVSRMERVELFEEEPRGSAKVVDLRAGVSRGPLAARLLLSNALNYLHALVPRTLAPVRTASLSVRWQY